MITWPVIKQLFEKPGPKTIEKPAWLQKTQ